MPKKYIKNREKLIISGLFLSKFDRKALEVLRCSSFLEAFNILGYALGGKPTNIKNYRDEFDPYFPNKRLGWHKRELREYCKKVYDKYASLTIDDFYEIISSFIIRDYEDKKQISEFLDLNMDCSFMKRVATGKAAEEYFKINYKKYFTDFSLLDTRDFGCGFDFKLESKNTFYYIEVKGLSENKGSFSLTQKEYDAAKKLQDKYCLFVVKNLKENPQESIFYNPLESLTLESKEHIITTISYYGSV